MGRRYNTRNCRLRESDIVTMKYAKRAVIVTGGSIDRGRASTISPWESQTRQEEGGRFADTRTLMDKLIDGELDYVGQIRVKR